MTSLPNCTAGETPESFDQNPTATPCPAMATTVRRS
jgi:hypothetical protein